MYTITYTRGIRLLWILAFIASAIAAEAQPPNPHYVALLKWSPNQTTTVSLGSRPLSLAFDGANIWAATHSGVTKVRATDGTVLGSFSAGVFPSNIAYDGANIW